RWAGWRLRIIKLLLGGRGVPANRGFDLLDVRNGNLLHFINRIGKTPMQPRTQQSFVALTHGLAEVKLDRPFVLLHREETGPEENNHQHSHGHLDDGETALQCVRQGLRASILGHRHRRWWSIVRMMLVAVIVVVMIVIAHAAISSRAGWWDNLGATGTARCVGRKPASLWSSTIHPAHSG